jgi:hypothetical protein
MGHGLLTVDASTYLCYAVSMETSDTSVPGTYVPKGFHKVNTACQAEPDLWFSGFDRDKDVAKGICQSCPEKMACLKQALEDKEVFGIWGGEDFSTDSPKQTAPVVVPKLCRKGLHVLPEQGRCKACIKINRSDYNKTDKARDYRKNYNRKYKRKNVLGGTCSSGKHTLTEENTQIRSSDGALMCQDCLRSLSRVRFKTDTGEKHARSYTAS